MTAREVAPAKSDNGGLALRRASPFNLLQHEIDRVFDSFANWRGFEPAAFTPSMNVSETDKTIEVSTELPGMDEKDVEISIANDILSIRGEKKAEKEEKGKNYRLYERTHGSFERSLALPPGIKPDDIKASMSKGVLKITLPKPATAQQQKIAIAAES
ncbi:MAG: Hsp20/alpha crystallin family protein [Hyphomonadaceae bacterium]|nr:Hsp20/alpha crystallin family protein [Hyphomonadaceae bacterium]